MKRFIPFLKILKVAYLSLKYFQSDPEVPQSEYHFTLLLGSFLSLFLFRVSAFATTNKNRYKNFKTLTSFEPFTTSRLYEHTSRIRNPRSFSIPRMQLLFLLRIKSIVIEIENLAMVRSRRSRTFRRVMIID